MVCYGEVRRKHTRSNLPSAFYLFCTSILLRAAQAQSAVGCADGSSEGTLGNGTVVACEGNWFGHVRRAHSLCAFGWKLCSWQDGKVLRNVTWEDALTVEGCYVYDASQDGGRCRECRDSLQRDDMAGVGKGCPYQNKGHASCISGGRIDASCCVESHFRRACSFIPGLTSGVLCCKSPDRAPRIVVKPREQLHVFSSHIFLVSCQATGSPTPRTLWYKDGKRLPHNNSRLSVLKSGDLLVTLARSGDSGLYTCEVINSLGVDTATSHVIVTDYQSGCSDGSTEGLLRHRDIHACAGRWSGHVKRARRLCAKGWAVCNPKDKGTIAKLSWPDIMGLKGCYALNIANTGNGCNRCYSKKMAGVGKKCSRIRVHRNSCFTKGRIDVYDPRHSTCDFQEGHVTGALCCRRKSRRHVKPKWSCDPECQNGGRCVGQNRCECKPGYKGVSCQNAICSPACEFGFVCEKPDQCTCPPGARGNLCRKTIKQLCVSPCLNGGRCKKGRCKCPPTHWGRTCAHELHRLFLTDNNRTER